VCAFIEKLILRDIDPIDDPDAVYEAIYANFENFKKAVATLKKQFLTGVNAAIESDAEESSISEETEEITVNIPDLDLDEDDEDEQFDTTPLEQPRVDETAVKKELLMAQQPKPEPPTAIHEIPASADVLESDAADDDLFMDFVNEAKEYVTLLESHMLDLEQQPNNLALINEIFRPFHTLKGVSGFMGLNKINHVSHEAENILDKARNGKLALTNEISALIFNAIDLIKKIISGLDVVNKKRKCIRCRS
jgi:HPt (histidine-containing phosphotransfer) domain-containing protein